MAVYKTNAQKKLVKVAGNYRPTFISNPNLLINGDFRVNQRGQTSYVDAAYTVDRWWKNAQSTFVVNADNSITLTRTTTTSNRYIIQWIEDYETLLGKTITISAKVKNVNANVPYQIGIYNGSVISSVSGNYSGGEEIIKTTIVVPSNWTKLGIIFYPNEQLVANTSATIEYVKAEIGAIATPFIPRPYAEELALCQRYTIVDNEWRTGYNRCGNGAAGSATEVFIALPIPVSLRTKPTMYYKEGTATPTTTKPALLRLLSYSSGALAAKDTTSLVVAKLNAGEMLIQVKSSGLTIGHIQSLYYASSGILQIIYDAEIY